MITRTIQNAVVEETVKQDDETGAEKEKITSAENRMEIEAQKSQRDTEKDAPEETAVQIQEINDHLMLSQRIEAGAEKKVGQSFDYRF